MAVSSISSDDWTLGEFCAGTGMLGVAIESVCSVWFGRRVVPVVYCERDACAAASIVDRMEKTGVGIAPVWDDLTTFDGRRWRGCVDIACAGLPCPAYSQAGKRAGNADARAWGRDGTSGPVPQFLRIVGEMQPALVFLENVSAWVTGGWFEPVGEELCRLGYTVQDPFFLAAEDIGAPHRRERVFILAHRQGQGQQRTESAGFLRNHGCLRKCDGELGDAPDADGRLATRGARAGQTPDEGSGGMGDSECADSRCGTEQGAQAEGGRNRLAVGNILVGNTKRDGGRSEQSRQGTNRRTVDRRPSETLGDARQHIGQSRAERQRTGKRSLSLFPPGPGLGLAGTVDDIGKLLSRDPHRAWQRYQAELANTLRWREILREHPEVEPGLPGLVDGLVARSDSLRLGGNGVVPLAAAVAFGCLLSGVPD